VLDKLQLWGPDRSPVSALCVACDWRGLAEGSYIDNAVHCSLEPMAAQRVRLRCAWAEGGAARQAEQPLARALRVRTSSCGALLLLHARPPTHCTRTH
jgi:hypothetical protein